MKVISHGGGLIHVRHFVEWEQPCLTINAITLLGLGDLDPKWLKMHGCNTLEFTRFDYKIIQDVDQVLTF